jgi:AcrR family transcriptional regulator
MDVDGPGRLAGGAPADRAASSRVVSPDDVPAPVPVPVTTPVVAHRRAGDREPGAGHGIGSIATAGAGAGGRPRDPRIDQAILAATRLLLVSVGYNRLSFELVARRAKVTRPTIYRRWPSKMHLVHEAVFPDAGPTLVPDTGEFRTDIRRMVHRHYDSYARPEARAALPGLLVDLHERPQLRAAVVDGLENRVRAQFAEIVRRAAERGEVDAGVDPDVVLDVVTGSLLQRVVARERLADGFADHLADLIIRGVAPRPSPDRAAPA